MNTRRRSSSSFAFVRNFLTVTALTLLAAWTLSSQAKAQAAPSGVPSYPVGGVSVAVPVPPGMGMVEVGDYRVKYEVVTPDSNRLVAAFVSESDVAKLRNGGTGGINPYALVEVLRAAEFSDLSASDFKSLVDSASNQIGAVIDSTYKETEAEFNKRMKALNQNTQETLGQPVMLGTFFYKTDAYSFGMLAPVTVNGTTIKMVVGTVLLRARNRVLFAYFYEVYKDDQTPAQVRAVSEQWTDAILAANAQ
ncbi:MAG: hypothetical protein ABR957_05300 [Terracidiphilus sp.]